MQAFAASVGFFGASVWDIAANHGVLARVVAGLFGAGLRNLGLI